MARFVYQRHGVLSTNQHSILVYDVDENGVAYPAEHVPSTVDVCMPSPLIVSQAYQRQYGRVADRAQFTNSLT